MIHKIKLIPVSPASIKAGYIPKYAFHVARFDEDGNYKGFVTQTPKLINRLNAYLQKFAVDLPTDEPKPRLDQMSLDV